MLRDSVADLIDFIPSALRTSSPPTLFYWSGIWKKFTKKLPDRIKYDEAFLQVKVLRKVRVITPKSIGSFQILLFLLPYSRYLDYESVRLVKPWQFVARQRTGQSLCTPSLCLDKIKLITIFVQWLFQQVKWWKQATQPDFADMLSAFDRFIFLFSIRIFRYHFFLHSEVNKQ